VSKLGTQKNNNKQAAKKSSTLPKWSQIGDPRGGQSSATLQLFRNFLRPGLEMCPVSSRGPKKFARGVQKVPQGFQKAPQFSNFFLELNLLMYPVAFGLPATVP